MATNFNAKRRDLKKVAKERTNAIKKRQVPWTVPAQRTKKQNKIDRKIR